MVSDLILEAQRAGFRVFEDEGLWWIEVPARPRHPAHTQGVFNTSERAWMAACLIARDVDA